MTYRCYKCGSKLEKQGHPDGLGYQSYRCPEGHEFWHSWKWRLSKHIKEAIFLAVLALALVAVSPLYLARRVKEGING